MVEAFRYRDRMEGIPIHDEQGSHDRPHDLTTIFEICHLAPAEREQFLTLYREAHPDRLQKPPRPFNAPHELRIALPQFQAEATAREVEAMILDFATRTIRLAQHAEKTAPNDTDKRRKRS